MLALTSGAQGVSKNERGFSLDNGDIHTRVTFLSPSIVRIEKSPDGMYSQPESVVVTMTPQKTATKIAETGSSVSAATSVLTVAVDKATGRVSFSDRSGSPLLDEKSYSFTMRGTGADKGAYIATQTYSLDADEQIYGLGILQEDKLGKRGTSRRMQQANTEDYVPMVQSVKGWGLYWDNLSPTLFEDNANGMTFSSDVAGAIDYYFMLGGSVDGVNAKMRELSGTVPMLPKWTYGFFQSKERYKSFAELHEVVDTYREQGIPLDCIVQDWQYWGSHYLWNAMEFLTGDFANPVENIGRLHDKNCHAMITIWSSFGPHTKQYREMEPKGMLFDIKTWPQSGISDFWPPRQDYPSGVKPYDVYNKEARDIYWKHLTRLYDAGIDAWWMDSTEPDHMDYSDKDLEQPTAMGSWRKVRNAYPLMAVEGVYDNHRNHILRHPDTVTAGKRVAIMTRCAFAGQQRTGANTWSGDVGSSWESLRKQIPAGLNFSMTGNPNYNSDIGGFFAGAYNKGYLDDSAMRNPLYQELYVRWMQFGLFNPIMRSHGTEVSREIYKYGKPGEPVYDALVDAVKTRYTLIPYIYSTAHDVTAHNGSYMRALVSDFKDDRNVWDMAHEYMFGKSLLAAPVVHAQYTPEKTVAVDPMSGWNRKDGGNEDGIRIDPWTEVKSTEVYLPKGADWYDWFTGEKYEGGQTIAVQTTLATIPLYARSGSIVPVGEVMQYVDERPAENLEIRVYSGADGEFELYEDEGDGYDYEKGVCATIPFKWDDRSGKLTIGRRNGSFPGMLQNRMFTIVCYGSDGNTDRKEVSYTGKPVTLRLKK